MAALTIKIGDEAQAATSPVDDGLPPQAKVSINARRSLDGNFMIFDHPEIDIVVMPEQQRVVSFSKDKASKYVYEAQDRLFRYLMKRGVVDFESIQGGHLYNSLEATILESKVEGVDAVQSVLFNISKFLLEEKPYYSYVQAHYDQEEESLLDPDAEHSTELGEVPQEETKGSIFPGMAPYALYYEYR